MSDSFISCIAHPILYCSPSIKFSSCSVTNKRISAKKRNKSKNELPPRRVEPSSTRSKGKSCTSTLKIRCRLMRQILYMYSGTTLYVLQYENFPEIFHPPPILLASRGIWTPGGDIPPSPRAQVCPVRWV